MFTKCDAPLENSKQMRQIFLGESSSMKVKEYVTEMLENNIAWESLKAWKYPPKEYVELESKYTYVVSCSLV